MANSRSQTIIGGEVLIGFRHFYEGVLTNASSVMDVSILDPDTLEVRHVIPGPSIVNVDTGMYQALVPAGILSKIGNWRDSWRVQSVPGATIRHFNFTITVVNALSFGGPGSGLQPSLEEITNCNLYNLDACMLKKHYLWPVWSVLSNGYYLPDSTLQHHIDNSISWAQRQIGVPFRQTRVRTLPFGEDAGSMVLGTDYDETGDLIEWSEPDSQHWSTIRLPHTNIIRVLSVRGIYGGRQVYRIPDVWVQRNEIKNGFVRIRPTTTGSIANIIDGSGRFLDVTLLESLGMNFVPGFWAVDYDYGFEGGAIPRELCDVVMKKASILLLDQLGQAIGRGLSSRSASVDGLSSQISNVANSERTMFGALARRYEEELAPENLKDLRLYHKGMGIFIA